MNMIFAGLVYAAIIFWSGIAYSPTGLASILFGSDLDRAGFSLAHAIANPKDRDCPSKKCSLVAEVIVGDCIVELLRHRGENDAMAGSDSYTITLVKFDHTEVPITDFSILSPSYAQVKTYFEVHEATFRCFS